MRKSGIRQTAATSTLEHCVLTARDLGRNLALPYRQVPLSRTADKAAGESGNPVRAIDFG
jgi:hypothetical protein